MEGKVPLCVCIGIHYEHSWWYLVLCDAIATAAADDDDDVDLVKIMHTLPISEICVVEGSAVKALAWCPIFLEVSFLSLILIFIDLKVKLFHITFE